VNYDLEILLICVAIILYAAFVVNRLRRNQQMVVLVGCIAMAIQASFPPCTYPDGTSSRQFVGDSSYRPSGIGATVDVAQQTTLLMATFAVTFFICCILERRAMNSHGPFS
jgi:hypothetical protein